MRYTNSPCLVDLEVRRSFQEPQSIIADHTHTNLHEPKTEHMSKVFFLGCVLAFFKCTITSTVR
jgi:hypothetical protein